MADLTDELAGLNENARLLLEKYDGVFAQLDEQSKQALIDIANKSDEGLQAIQTLLDNGVVAEAENALKLGGKSLDEIYSNIYAYGYSDDIQVVQAVGFIKVEFNNKFEDGIAIDVDNSNFIIPIDGVYIIIIEFSHYKGDGSRQNDDNRCAIYLNGTNTQESIFIEVESTLYDDGTSNDKTNGFKTATFIQKLKKDDVVDVRVGNDFTADIYRSKISVAKI